MNNGIVMCKAITAILCCIFVQERALANGAPGYPGTLEAEVLGENVKLSQDMPENSYCEVFRRDLDNNVTVELGEYGWDSYELVGDDSIEDWNICDPQGSNIDCQETPEQCVDCDGDGSQECPGICYQWGRFEIVDECVPVGAIEGEREYEYGVEDCYIMGVMSDKSIESQTVTVERVDQCQRPTDGSAACHVRRLGGKETGLPAAGVILIVFGTLVLTMTRRYLE